MEVTLGRSRGGPLALLIAAALFCAGVAYFTGLIQTLGYESRHVTFSGFASGTKSGGGFGLKHMVFFEGQTFFAEYDAEVRSGSLRIGILETLGSHKSAPHFVESITESGSGEVTFRIPKTTVYSIYFDGSVLGNSQGRGYDVAYSVRWGAR
jgi:hypothetical protein